MHPTHAPDDTAAGILRKIIACLLDLTPKCKAYNYLVIEISEPPGLSGMAMLLGLGRRY